MKKEFSMEARLLLAFVLMGAVIWLTPYFIKTPPAPQKTTASKPPATDTGAPATDAAANAAIKEKAAAEKAALDQAGKEKAAAERAARDKSGKAKAGKGKPGVPAAAEDEAPLDVQADKEETVTI